MILFISSGCGEKLADGFAAWLGEGGGDYTQVIPDVTLTFPDDHRAHTDFRHEWWYFTANLVDEQGSSFGVQWTQFRIAVAPDQSETGQSASSDSWSSRQLYMAHSAITTAEQHYADEKWSREHPRLAGVEVSPLRVFLDDWQWLAQSDDLLPARLNVDSELFSYQLKLTSSAPYHKQGQQGYSQKSASAEVASYYYSQPFIEVNGEININGKQHRVSGKGWIDREWSSQFLLGSQQGWDWFALRLNEQTSLVVFQLRDAKTGEANYAYARLMYHSGKGVAIRQNEITLRPVSRTRIQASNYPTQWQLSLPNHGIELTISALNPNAKMSLTVPYWEGPVEFKGTHSGKGYMELTGY
ncbi:lipocalin-like domain-containing protein [Vibrio sp. CAU 1672]|uniref:lipocalin-like domain-containing protein n=1 Tax=Vibrio sp. CAU 1672 TaxID=3032594 RepID=UPI0023DB260B|nr:lipocalin-like domain-containing protein [Vibrio sp. CAU 1672]MDF2152297.1 lipocalin-like domain-containing protein [Vibrio sp. CAU 1672]